MKNFKISPNIPEKQTPNPPKPPKTPKTPKKIFARHKRVLALIWCLVFLSVAVVHLPTAAAPSANQVLKIGLKYGDDALGEAKLQNKTGSGAGFAFGTLDANRNFAAQATTDKTILSIRKAGNGLAVYEFDTENKLFDFSGDTLCISPLAPDGVKPITWFNLYRYYGMFTFERLGGDKITVCNVVNMQDYVKGVLPYEISPDWPLEAQKAQAVAAKCHAQNKLNKHKNFDLCNTDDCQVYMGTGNATELSDRAVDETLGAYVMYGDKVAVTYFHNSDGGATEDSNLVWGGDKVPYLKGVDDPFDGYYNDKATATVWGFTCTNDDLTKMLRAKGEDCADIVDFYVSEYTAMGNVRSITFVDANGKTIVKSGENCRTYPNNTAAGGVIRMRSQRFSITKGKASLYVQSDKKKVKIPEISAAEVPSDNKTADRFGTLQVVNGSGKVYRLPAADNVKIIDGSGKLKGTPVSKSSTTYTVDGRGWGNNVGMSQWGAYGMAKKGYNYKQILTFYYPGTTVEIF